MARRDRSFKIADAEVLELKPTEIKIHFCAHIAQLKQRYMSDDFTTMKELVTFLVNAYISKEPEIVDLVLRVRRDGHLYNHKKLRGAEIMVEKGRTNYENLFGSDDMKDVYDKLKRDEEE